MMLPQLQWVQIFVAVMFVPSIYRAQNGLCPCACTYNGPLCTAPQIPLQTAEMILNILYHPHCFHGWYLHTVEKLR